MPPWRLGPQMQRPDPLRSVASQAVGVAKPHRDQRQHADELLPSWSLPPDSRVAAVAVDSKTCESTEPHSRRLHETVVLQTGNWTDLCIKGSSGNA